MAITLRDTNILCSGFKTRSRGQKPAHKDLGCNGQRPAITPKATYALTLFYSFSPCFFPRDSLNLYIERMAYGSCACLPEFVLYF
ncbi:hypothetical protein BVJ53_03415 [Lacticaseibacillus chiayiensis]|uniref:Alpha-galactosidase n=1 Tax=Lacticaseibacillus chiayiensis TaxID=2100821 RepID=A0A4Q1UAU1_9LACO|nr:hypothetical protein BVJ53_03415 [Lacticaseibacillus chiayiensis]RXT58748.1 hypothetical protein CHT97_04375 [Lacticaseibacillus chiayiensis]